MNNLNEQEYKIFTAKQEADKAINSLKGILLGINLDNEVNEKEINELNQWVAEHNSLIRKNPFKEFMNLIQSIIQEAMPTKEIIEDLWWLTQKYEGDNYYYDAVTSDLQILHGLCHGILADGIINDNEISELDKWLEGNKHLLNHYPYDELSALLLSVLSDKKIDEEERNILKAYFNQFANIKDKKIKKEIIDETKNTLISGLCTSDINIVFEQRKFCITGILKRSPRKELRNDIIKLGGIPVDNVTDDTDYLIVGDNGNLAWSFACYGRKVEHAILLRKKGHRISIVNEFDFCDIVDDLK